MPLLPPTYVGSVPAETRTAKHASSCDRVSTPMRLMLMPLFTGTVSHRFNTGKCAEVRRARSSRTFPLLPEYGSRKRETTSRCPSVGRGEALRAAGGSFRLTLKEPFYIGLGVCAHDSNAVEKALFSNVNVTIEKATSIGEPMLESTLETIAIASKDRRVVYHTRGRIEAPNWSKDGKYLLFNSKGNIYSLPIGGGEPLLLNTGFATQCNNDHGISPDGAQLAISDQTKDGKSRIYLLPVSGGTPRLVTPSRAILLARLVARWENAGVLC